MSKSTLPSVFSYARSIDVTEGFFYSEVNGVEKPLPIIERTNRGTHSDYKSSRSKKTSEELAGNNISVTDRCIMPPESDTLLIRFNVKFINRSLKPHSCNDSDITDKLSRLTQLYSERGGYQYLAKRYAQQIAWGAFLFRNRNKSEEFLITIKPTSKNASGESFVFCPPYDDEEWVNFFDKEASSISSLATLIEDAFRGKSPMTNFKVEARVKVNPGDEVYPSQSFVDKSKQLESKTYLASMRCGQINQAIFHGVKIGNAIRTIDDWFDESNNRRIAVEPLGQDNDKGIAIRHKQKNDFFTLFEKNLTQYLSDLDGVKHVDELSDQNIHFFIACLIRGGVFSGNSKK